MASSASDVQAMPSQDLAVRDVLLQIAVKSSRRRHGPASIALLRARILEKRRVIDMVFTRIVQQLVILYPGPRGLQPKPFPLVFALDQIYTERSLLPVVPFDRVDKADPYASKERLRAYRNAPNNNTRAWIAVLAAGSKEKAIADASRGDWDEANYRLQGAFLRLLTRQKRATVEAGWRLRGLPPRLDSCRVSTPVSEYALERERNTIAGGQNACYCSAGRRALVIHHENADDRNACLHELFEIWYHVALVNEHRVYQARLARYPLHLRFATSIKLALLALENAANLLRSVSSNRSLRQVQLSYVQGWLYLCYAEVPEGTAFRGRKRRLDDKASLSCTFFEAAGNQAREMLGNYHAWTKECDSKVALLESAYLKYQTMAVAEGPIASDIIERFRVHLNKPPGKKWWACFDDPCRACMLYSLQLLALVDKGAKQKLGLKTLECGRQILNTMIDKLFPDSTVPDTTPIRDYEFVEHEVLWLDVEDCLADQRIRYEYLVSLRDYYQFLDLRDVLRSDEQGAGSI